MLSGKAGITHVHLGENERGLALLRTLVEEYNVEPAWLYPTHVERSETQMEEALEFVRRGATIDIDVVEKDLPKWLRYYFERDGDPGRLTVSSDAFLTGPHNLLGQLRACVVEHGFPLEQVLPLVTANTARVLKLEAKGRLKEGSDADVVVFEHGALEVVEVIARGKRLVRDGVLVAREGFLDRSDRRIHLVGTKEDG